MHGLTSIATNDGGQAHSAVTSNDPKRRNETAVAILQENEVRIAMSPAIGHLATEPSSTRSRHSTDEPMGAPRPSAELVVLGVGAEELVESADLLDAVASEQHASAAHHRPQLKLVTNLDKLTDSVRGQARSQDADARMSGGHVEHRLKARWVEVQVVRAHDAELAVAAQPIANGDVRATRVTEIASSVHDSDVLAEVQG